MPRLEPTTAAAAVAVTLSMGTFGRQLGLAPVPPGLVQLFGPVAGAAGQFATHSLRRGIVVSLVLLSPIWGAAVLSASSSMPVIEEHLELPNAGITVLAPAAALLWAVRDFGACAELTSVRRTSGGRADRRRRWFALSSTRIKQRRGALAARPDARGTAHNSP
jgi:hypothetical protein